MYRNRILLVILISFFSGLQCTYGQAHRDKVYSDPDEVRLDAHQTLAKAIHKAFSRDELAQLCAKGKGYISFACQVDTSGRIEQITSVKCYDAALKLPVAALRKLKESIRQNVVFHVPSVTKNPRMARFRRPSVVIPLRAFCQ